MDADILDSDHSPRKRLKMDHIESVTTNTAEGILEDNTDNKTGSAMGGPTASSTEPDQNAVFRELKVGISAYVDHVAPRFEALLKKRYTDFLVNEILPNGKVVHLDSLEVPRVKEPHPEPLPVTGKAEEASNPNEASCKPDVTYTSVSSTPSVVQSQSQTTTSTEKNPEESGSAANWRNYADKFQGFTLSVEDREILEAHLGPSVTDETLSLFNRVVESPHRKSSQYGIIKSENPINRESRKTLHEAVRRIFSSRLESYTEEDGIFVLAATSQRPLNGGGRSHRDGKNKSGHGEGPRDDRQVMSLKARFASLGGDYVHFSLYKENRDTMEVISFIARQLQLNVKLFQFAGTKDRRAITTQRVSAHRVMAGRLAGINSKLNGSKVGNFNHQGEGLSLGDLKGNEFVITLREFAIEGTNDLHMEEKVSKASDIMTAAVTNLITNGFVNYFGLQRFGTYSLRTDDVGVRLLKEDFEGAVNTILNFNSSVLAAALDSANSGENFNSDDKARAIAIDTFRKTGKSGLALDKLPRKFSGESNIIRYLGGKAGKKDYLGAILSIPRNLRLMYVHAYQSSVWNYAASHRWSIAGSQVLEGDLVLVNEHREKTAAKPNDLDVDDDGEPIVYPADHDQAIRDEDRFERARPLSKEEAESGMYTIFDIVLPTPGFDVLYPPHMVGFYEELMSREEFGELDPHSMRRKVKDLSLSGNYRKLLARPLARPEFRVVAYTKDNEQFVKTDLDLLHEAKRSKKVAERKLDNANSAAAEETKTTDDMGLDGAVESKIQSIRDALLGSTGQETETNEERDLEPAEDEAVLTSAKPNETDLEANAMVTEEPTGPEKLAVILTLQLGSSTYATMALRELSKGGIRAYKPDFGGGR